MCGICGIVEQEARGRIDMGVLRRMTDSLVHRGPDDEGLWTDQSAGVGLGFRRLAILDLSPTGHQPMESADGRYVIAFNGEIYNHRELRRELAEQGTCFRGSSDTEVILEAASRLGAEAAIARLWGMFAIALWDREARAMLLARDRLGKKPLYYTQQHGAVVFASELKALRAVPWLQLEVDRDALAAYMRFGYVPAPQAIYRGVSKLPPGCLAWHRTSLPTEVRSFWRARDVALAGAAAPMLSSDEEAVAELDGLLRDAVARRMIADVPLGAFLSGGIDSSAVVALMQAQSARPVRTFSIGSGEARYNEAEAAKDVAAHLGTDHTELYVSGNDALALIPLLPEIYDEPFADSSQIPTYLVSALARRAVTVVLSGDGGDELFAGYDRHFWAQRLWRATGWMPLRARTALGRRLQGIPPERWDRWYARAEPLLPQRLRGLHVGALAHQAAGVVACAGPDALYERLVSIWKQPEALVRAGGHPVVSHTLAAADFPSFLDRMLFSDLVTYLPDDILVKVDRASMAVSLEARAPLLDHRVVEWAWRLPPHMKVREGRGKWILRQVVHRYVPAALVDRPKTGFSVPVDVWLRGPLRDWAESLLDERRLAGEGYLEPAPVRQAWTRHLSKATDEQHRLWAVLMFGSWLERQRAPLPPALSPRQEQARR